MAVGDRGFAGEIDGDGVLGLHVVEAGEDEAEDLLGVRTHLGDRVRGRDARWPERVQVLTGFLSFRCSLARRFDQRGTLKIGTAG